MSNLKEDGRLAECYFKGALAHHFQLLSLLAHPFLKDAKMNVSVKMDHQSFLCCGNNFLTTEKKTFGIAIGKMSLIKSMLVL